MSIWDFNKQWQKNDDENRSYDSQPESPLFSGLNERQREAVLATEGYVRVIAGAGSGKTKTLAHRFAYIVNELGISPSNILSVTFTNKAAQEMKNRVRNFVDMGDVNDFICTYHGFCVKVLREDISKIGYPTSFIIMDEEDQKSLMREIYEELNLKQTDLTFKDILSKISQWKYSVSYIADYIDVDSSRVDSIPPDADVIYKCIIRYVQKQRKSFMLDFDDLMLITLYIFEKDAEVLGKWQRRLDYIMVDEVQDNSAIQWKLVELLQEYHKNLFVVGDPDQCIYEWRGARPDTLVNFDKVYSPCKTIILDRNYRSTPNILDVANSVISNNRRRVPKNLYTTKPPVANVTHFHGKTEEEEGNFIAQHIKMHLQEGGAYSDVAVLFRAAHVSRFVEQALVRHKIPYVVYGGVRFFERQEVKDVLAYMRMADVADDLSFRRVINLPKRKLGKVFMKELKELADAEGTTLYEALYRHIKEPQFSKTGALEFVELVESAREAFSEMTLSDATQYMLERSGLMAMYRTDGDQDRVDNLNELLTSIRLYEKANENEENLSLAKYLQDIALFTNIDRPDERDNVKIMTVHQSKGLEFPVVFVAGASEGIFPNHRSIRERKLDGLEEERRLAYVAFTRAEKELFLTESEGANFQAGGFKFPSRFIFEIKKNLLVRQGVLTKELEKQARNFIEITDRTLIDTPSDGIMTFKPGTKVRHKVFGEGLILHVEERTQTVEVIFTATGSTKHFSTKLIGTVLQLL